MFCVLKPLSLFLPVEKKVDWFFKALSSGGACISLLSKEMTPKRTTCFWPQAVSSARPPTHASGGIRLVANLKSVLPQPPHLLEYVCGTATISSNNRRSDSVVKGGELIPVISTENPDYSTIRHIRGNVRIHGLSVDRSGLHCLNSKIHAMAPFADGSIYPTLRATARQPFARQSNSSIAHSHTVDDALSRAQLIHCLATPRSDALSYTRFPHVYRGHGSVVYAARPR